MALNAKQRIFVKEYLVDKNATRAAKVAGYTSPRQLGSRLLSKVDIKAAIEKGLGALEKKSEVNAERVINQIATIAFEKLSHHERVRLSQNQLKALEMLGKHFNLIDRGTPPADGGAPSNGPDAHGVVTRYILPLNGTEDPDTLPRGEEITPTPPPGVKVG